MLSYACDTRMGHDVTKLQSPSILIGNATSLLPITTPNLMKIDGYNEVWIPFRSSATGT